MPTNFDLILFMVLFKIEFVGDSDTPDDDLERSNDNDVIEGFWFSFWEEDDSEDEDDSDEADEGDANSDIDRSRGLSVGAI
jgi:hypothetical protein